MTPEQRASLELLVSETLDEAEAVWNKVEPKLTALANHSRQMMLEKMAMPTRIPGYPIIEDGIPIVDEFIALIADMRDSTKHLLQAISLKTSKVSQLQRVYYETTALVTALAQVVEWDTGAVTEYLGDGILALFKASPDRDKSIYAAHRAAKNCLLAREEVINPILNKRYGLPPIDIGIGMAYSKAVVTVVGLASYKQPKVFGECVFRASKLAHEVNKIVVDEAMNLAWPTSKDGKLKFELIMFGDLKGHRIL